MAPLGRFEVIHARVLRVSFVAVVSLSALAPGLGAGPPVPPRPDRYVTDPAGFLPSRRAEALNERLAAFERETSSQLLVWIAPRVPEGTTPEELGASAIRAWGVGQKGKSNGLVFFVFPEDRKMRIATGYGLEGAIPDAIAKRITSEVVKPFFARGDIPGGVEAGVDALMATARGEGVRGTGRTAAETRGRSGAGSSYWWAGLLVLAVVFTTAAFKRSVVPGTLGVLTGFAMVLILLVSDESRFLAPGLLLMLGSFGAILVGAMRRPSGETSVGRPSDSRNGGSPESSSSSFSSSDSGSSSSSSSDFSGGGGDSGGGGASDSW